MCSIIQVALQYIQVSRDNNTNTPVDVHRDTFNSFSGNG